MNKLFIIDENQIDLDKVMDFIFSRKKFKSIVLSDNLKKKVEKSFHHLVELLEKIFLSTVSQLDLVPVATESSQKKGERNHRKISYLTSYAGLVISLN